MRRSILAFVMVAIVVAAAQPAAAIDNGFRGRYRLIERETSHACPVGSDRRRVEVTYVSERVREIDPDHSTAGANWRFRYVRGERFPWQTNDGRFVLRYSRRTDSAVGTRDGLQECRFHVRLVPMG